MFAERVFRQKNSILTTGANLTTPANLGTPDTPPPPFIYTGLTRFMIEDKFGQIFIWRVVYFEIKHYFLCKSTLKSELVN